MGSCEPRCICNPERVCVTPPLPATQNQEVICVELGSGRDIRYLIENFYDIQKLRIETYNRIVCYIKENAEKVKEEVSEGARELIEKKKYAEFVKKYVLTEKINISDVKNLVWYHNQLYETEKGLYKRIDSWSRNHPLRREFLNHVKGIGAVLSSGIIAWLCDPILKADKVSQLWSYCGLAPNQERRKGEKVSYNPKVKVLCWKVGQSFIKFRCFGRRLYLDFRAYIEKREPEWSALHHHNWARRKVTKLFLAAVWEKWRRMNGLPVSEPYAISILGHAEKVRPEDWTEAKL